MTTLSQMEPHKEPDIQRRPQADGSAAAAKPAGAVYGELTHKGAPHAPHAGNPAADGTCAPSQLHICFHCAGELVYPLDWSEEGPRHWRIVLRCPECESRREGVFDQTAVERLDDELDRGSSALLGDLRRMTHANMSEEIEFFARALEADLILPSDF
jgi:hypothetical protein